MITILRQPNIYQNKYTGEIFKSYFVEADNLHFTFKGLNTTLKPFYLGIVSTKDKKLLDLQIELKELSLNRLSGICRLLGIHILPSELFNPSEVVIRLILKTEFIKNYFYEGFQSLKTINELFEIKDDFGKKILFNLNCYNVEKTGKIKYWI
jgi:hypothetical protein